MPGLSVHEGLWGAVVCPDRPVSLQPYMLPAPLCLGLGRRATSRGDIRVTVPQEIWPRLGTINFVVHVLLVRRCAILNSS
jgi:hypothetical protein